MVQILKKMSADKESKEADPKIDEMVEQMSSSDDREVLQATHAIRKISQETNPPIDAFIGLGVVSLCVPFLESKIKELPFEAALILTNIASGTSEQTKVVVKAGAVPKLVKLSQSNEIALANQSVWALGNIAGDGAVARNIVLEHGAAEQIVKLLEKEQPITFFRNIVWLMSNLCRHTNPPPPMEKVQILLPVLAKLLQKDDIQVLSDAAWAIGYATDWLPTDVENGRIEAVIEAGCVPSLIHLLDRREVDIVLPTLRSITNISSGSNAQVDVALEAGLLDHMKKLLNHTSSAIVERAAFIISNVSAGSTRQIKAVIDAGIFEDLRNVMEHGDTCAKKEAAYAIANVADHGTPEQILYLFQRVGILKPFRELVNLGDAVVDAIVKDGLFAFFKSAGTDIFQDPIQENCASDLSGKIEDLKLE